MRQLLLTMFVLALSSGVQADDRLLGIWKDSDNGITVKMVKTATGYEGLIERAPNNNPKAIGKRMLILDAGKDGEWRGTLFALKRNKELDTVARFVGPDSLELVSKLGWFSKTLIWQRLPTAN